jgi:hypothetical protein
MDFPMTEIGGISISRLVIGSNTFMGFSHFTASKDRWLKRYFTVERIVEVLEYCSEQGLNAICSSPEDKMYEALRIHEDKTGRHINWFCTPGGGNLQELHDGIEKTASVGAEFCMPHTSWTDARLIPAENRIIDYEEVARHIRDLGMRPGLSTHRPESIVVGDNAGYDIDVYIQPYNSVGFLCSVETDWTASVIRGTSKPVLSIKPLGANRIMPITGLSFVYHTIKPIDTVCIGMLSVEEAQEDIQIARDLLAGIEAEVELQYTRSKATLKKS